MRRTKRLLIAALVTAVAVPAPAAASVSGSIAFHCTAQLPAWPEQAGFGTCGDDTTPALGYVSMAGTDRAGIPYVVEGPGEFAAAFYYSTSCITNNEPSVGGSAVGDVFLYDVPATHGTLPTRATIHAKFLWTRLGVDAVLVITDWSVVFDHGASDSGTTGVGHATFLPLLGPSNVCPVGGPMKALVDGEVEVVS